MHLTSMCHVQVATCDNIILCRNNAKLNTKLTIACKCMLCRVSSLYQLSTWYQTHTHTVHTSTSSSRIFCLHG